MGEPNKVGRKLGPDSILARELGITTRRVRLQGGAEKLLKLDEPTRRLILKLSEKEEA